MKQTSTYVVGFAAAICVVCSVLLSAVSGALGPMQEKNRVLDKQKNILLAAGFTPDDIAAMDAAKVQSTYSNTLVEMVITPAGDVVSGKTPKDLDAKEQSGESKSPKFLPIFKQKDEAGNTLAYIYPVTGKGLWSTLYGYLAVKPDGNEIVGVAFYKHGETPGLGAEIEAPWFTKMFKGKKLRENGKLVGVQVVRGKVADKAGIDASHAVDGISGATLTGNGVGKMMVVEPMKYENFFKKSAR